jgi:hypothetical protein
MTNAWDLRDLMLDAFVPARGTSSNALTSVPAHLRQPWEAFCRGVGERLVRGANAYGNASLRATPRALAGEIEQELLDVMGWGFLLWLRLRNLEGKRRGKVGR